MESIQVKKLKLNATNIKTVLITGNRSLKKLRIEEKNLVIKQKQKIKAGKKEAVVEGKSIPGSGIVKSVGNKIKGNAMSFFDKIKEFFSLILFGILVNKLPKIIARVEKFFYDNRKIIDTIKTVIKTIGNVMMGLINVVKPFFGKKSDYVEKEKEFDKKVDQFTSEVGDTEKEFNDVDKKLRGEFDYENQTPEEIVETVKTEVITSNTDPVIYKQRIVRITELRKEKSGTGEKISLPGIGSFESREANPIGKFFGLSSNENKYFDPDGIEIKESQFTERLDALQNSSNFDDAIKGYSQGGTVGSSLKLGSPRLKTARKSINSFSRFQNNVLAQNKVLNTQKENNNIFSSIVDNFKKLIGINEELSNDSDDSSRPDSDGPLTDIPVASSSVERNLAAFLAFLEGGSGQTGADALQVMLNRAAQNHSGYGDLLGQITAQNQFSPYAAAIYNKATGDPDADRYYGKLRGKLGNNPTERIEKLKELATGPDALQNLANMFGKGPGAVRAASQLLTDFELNGTLSKSSRRFVGGRTSFRGYDPSRFGVKDAIRRGNRGNYIFDNSNTVGKIGEVSPDLPLVAEFKKVGEEVANSKPGDGSKHVYPGGVGTLVFGRGYLGKPENKYFNPSGERIRETEFYDRLNGVLKQNNLEYLIPKTERQRKQFTPVSRPVSEVNTLNRSFDGSDSKETVVVMTQPIIIPKTQIQTVIRNERQLVPIHISSKNDHKRRLV